MLHSSESLQVYASTGNPPTDSNFTPTHQVPPTTEIARLLTFLPRLLTVDAL